MEKPFRAVALTTVLVLVTFSVFVYFAPRASAAGRTWTTDADFNAPGSIFIATEVVGTGVPAEVNLIRSTTDWANRNPPSPTPGGLEGPGMAFDGTGNVSVLFGGYKGGVPNYSDKTWEYDFAGNTWTEITTTPKPPARQSPGLSYDPAQGVAVLFGGFNDSGFFTDTWEYAVSTNTWAQISTTGTPPQLADAPLETNARRVGTGVVAQEVVLGIVVGIGKGDLPEQPVAQPGDEMFARVGDALVVVDANQLSEFVVQVVHVGTDAAGVLCLDDVLELGQRERGEVQCRKRHVDEGDAIHGSSVPSASAAWNAES